MGAKKWSTILQENYIKTGRLFNNYSLEKEIEYYSKAGFSSPEELIEWAYFTHDTLKYFFNLYFYTVPNTKTLASIVKGSVRLKDNKSNSI